MTPDYQALARAALRLHEGAQNDRLFPSGETVGILLAGAEAVVRCQQLEAENTALREYIQQRGLEAMSLGEKRADTGNPGP